MLKFLLRAVAAGAMAAVLTAATAVSGIGTTAANAYWTETYTGHVDLVIDWYEVPTAAAGAQNNADECQAVREASSSTLAYLDVEWCAYYAMRCASAAHNDPRYTGHPVRVIFYANETQECRVIGVA